MRALLLALALIGLPAAEASVRIKDITSVRGVRANQLVGYGLVIGLNGTGDSLRNAPFTEQSIQSMLDRMGVNVRNSGARTKNVAAVIVTAELPAFAGKGAHIDVTVSSLGDATSLSGGSLVLTPLMGADNVIYAVGQGQIAVSGFASGGRAETITQGVPTSGRIANGAIIERQPPSDFGRDRAMTLELNNPDFGTAVGIVDAINAYARTRYGRAVAAERDLRSVALSRPPEVSAARFIAEIGELTTVSDMPARVVVDERTGTIVIGRDVQIATVAIAHGNLTVRVTEEPVASQPAPLSRGETLALPRTSVDAVEQDGSVAIVGGASLQSLVAGLNKLGLKPQGIIAILQAIKTAGALQAELVVQ